MWRLARHCREAGCLRTDGHVSKAGGQLSMHEATHGQSLHHILQGIPCVILSLCMQSLAEYYSEARFLKTYGNVSEAAKYLFKERLKARVTPTFYMFRNGKHLSLSSGCTHR